MLNFIASFKILNISLIDFELTISIVNDLAILLELIFASYRSRIIELVNKVYKVDIKFNYARSYLFTLEKHKFDEIYFFKIDN